MLRTEDISVQFGGVRAIGGAGFDVGAGAVTGLIGPNGAGKTTMFNVITGLQRPNTGKVWLDGTDVTRVGARKRALLGIGRTFQRLEVFTSLSARDNVLVALEARGGRNKKARADELLAKVGLSDEADTTADVLPTGQARLVELARALATDPKVLLLDEASSGLDSQESERFGETLLELAKEGMAVLMVEHDMDLVMAVCSRIHVLDFGQMIAEGTPDEIQRNPRVQAAYLGTEEVGTEEEAAEAAAEAEAAAAQEVQA